MEIDGIDFNFLMIDDRGFCTISYQAQARQDPCGGFRVHLDPTISVLFS